MEFFAKYVGDGDTPLPENTGEFKIFRNEEGLPKIMLFKCPCGGDHYARIGLKPADSNGWDFNGNLEKPTCTPSIAISGCCNWHGYLTEGVFKPC